MAETPGFRADPDDISTVSILSSSRSASAVRLKQYLSMGWEKLQEMQVLSKQQQQRLGNSRVFAIAAAAALAAFLVLVLVLAYQISGGSVSIWPDGADLNQFLHWQSTEHGPINSSFLPGPTFSKLPSPPWKP
jgi:ABC-type Fe3+ transport system permease subunit